MTQPLTEDEYRAVHAQYMRDEAGHVVRQTSALESIRGMLTFLVLLTVLNILASILLAAGVFD